MRSTRCWFSASAVACWPGSACSAICPPRACSTLPALDGLDALAGGERRAAYLPTMPPGDVLEGLDRRGRVGARAPARAACGAAHGGARQRPLVLGARRARRRRVRRRGGGRRRPAGRRRRVGRRGGRGSRGGAPLRRDPSLGHVTLDDASVEVLDVADTRARRRLVPGRRAARRRVGRQRGDRAGGIGRLREGTPHVRARDRLIPGDQAWPDRGAAPARRTPARCSTTPAGRAAAPPRSSRWRPAPRARLPGTRLTSRLAR